MLLAGWRRRPLGRRARGRAEERSQRPNRRSFRTPVCPKRTPNFETTLHVPGQVRSPLTWPHSERRDAPRSATVWVA